MVIAMDAETRAMIEQAIAADDAARASYEKFERKWAAREKAKAQPEIIYRTYEGPQPVQQQSAAVMDAQKTADWNRWFEQSFENAFIKAVDKYLVPAISGALTDEREEIEKALGEIRGQIEILRRHFATKDDMENVAPIRGRNVA
jgi:hypothetical protein